MFQAAVDGAHPCLGDSPYYLTGECTSNTGLTKWEWFRDNILMKQAVLSREASFSLSEATGFLCSHKDNFIKVFMIQNEELYHFGINRFQLGYVVPGEYLIRTIGFTWEPDSGKLTVFPDATSSLTVPQYDKFTTPEEAMLKIIELNFEGTNLMKKYKVVYALRKQYGFTVRDFNNLTAAPFDDLSCLLHYMVFDDTKSRLFPDVKIHHLYGLDPSKIKYFKIPVAATRKDSIVNFFVCSTGQMLTWDGEHFKLDTPGYKWSDVVFALGSDNMYWRGLTNYFNTFLETIVNDTNRVLDGNYPLNTFYNKYIDTNYTGLYKVNYSGEEDTFCGDRQLVTTTDKKSVTEYFRNQISLTKERSFVMWNFFSSTKFLPRLKHLVSELKTDLSYFKFSMYLRQAFDKKRSVSESELIELMKILKEDESMCQIVTQVFYVKKSRHACDYKVDVSVGNMES